MLVGGVFSCGHYANQVDKLSENSVTSIETLADGESSEQLDSETAELKKQYENNKGMSGLMAFIGFAILLGWESFKGLLKGLGKAF